MKKIRSNIRERIFSIATQEEIIEVYNYFLNILKEKTDTYRRCPFEKTKLRYDAIFYKRWIDQKLTLGDLADMFDVTRERVRQIEARLYRSITFHIIRFRRINDKFK